ncbi:MAG: DnaJ domain-containing protein [Chloroflexota bacterium]|nr:DnaJ domain-containing protein [Chloroflexota bacterium]
MAKRDPYAVLGVEPGAPPTAIKAAWRRLARQHHPDLIGDDPEASRVATRKMAEINEAYAAISRGDAAASRAGAGATNGGPTFEQGTERPRRGGPPRPKPTRPVTGRLDLSGTVRPRNAPIREPGPNGEVASATTLNGQPPIRFATHHREPPRASDPTGPLERARIRDFRRPTPPALEDAVVRPLEFGKFRGHTLGEVAAFEPSYIDWLAKTITRDPELVAAAKVLQADLDERGVPRREHPTTRDLPGRSA